MEVGDWVYNNELKVVKVTRIKKTITEVGDWLYFENRVAQHSSNFYKKILALPEHFSPKHLQAIVDGKMKDGDKVLVECEKQYHDGDQWHYKIKLNSSNHITLHKIEEKMYTREQVKKLLRLYVGGIHADGWFEQNINEI